MFTKIRVRRNAEVYGSLRKMAVESIKWERAFFSDSQYLRLSGGKLLGYDADLWEYNYWDKFEERSIKRIKKDVRFGDASARYESLFRAAHPPRKTSSTDIYPISVMYAG